MLTLNGAGFASSMVGGGGSSSGSGSPAPHRAGRDNVMGSGSRSASQAGRTSGEIIEEEDEDEIEEVDTFSPIAPGAEETVWEEADDADADEGGRGSDDWERMKERGRA